MQKWNTFLPRIFLVICFWFYIKLEVNLAKRGWEYQSPICNSSLIIGFGFVRDRDTCLCVLSFCLILSFVFTPIGFGAIRCLTKNCHCRYTMVKKKSPSSCLNTNYLVSGEQAYIYWLLVSKAHSEKIKK